MITALSRREHGFESRWGRQAQFPQESGFNKGSTASRTSTFQGTPILDKRAQISHFGMFFATNAKNVG